MPNEELIQLSDSTYYIPSPSNVGLYVVNGQAVIIDSGSNKEAGYYIQKILKDRKWELTLIINTHSNADHIGGNKFLQETTNCRIATTAMEATLIEYPILESTILNGGFPHKRLRNNFLLAEASLVTDIIPNSGIVLDTPLLSIPLPGHFLDMIAVKTPDNILFTADSVISEEILSKYHIHFLYNVKEHFKTLEMLKKREDLFFVPSHGKDVKNIEFRILVEYNEYKIRENINVVLDSVVTASSSEKVLASLCLHYGIELNANQYVLIFSTLKSILAYLLDNKQVTVTYKSGRMLWKQL